MQALWVRNPCSNPFKSIPTYRRRLYESQSLWLSISPGYVATSQEEECQSGHMTRISDAPWLEKPKACRLRLSAVNTLKFVNQYLFEYFASTFEARTIFFSHTKPASSNNPRLYTIVSAPADQAEDKAPSGKLKRPSIQELPKVTRRPQQSAPLASRKHTKKCQKGWGCYIIGTDCNYSLPTKRLRLSYKFTRTQW